MSDLDLGSVDSLAAFFDQQNSDDSIKNIPLNKIILDKELPQPRTIFENIEELAESIKAQGVIEPIVVTHDKDNDTYTLIAGERRYRASKIANLIDIPAVIRKLTRKEKVAVRLIENIERENFKVFDEANGIQQAVDEFGSAKEAAAALGKTQAWISKRTTICSSPNDVLLFIKEGFSDDLETMYQLASAAKKHPNDVAKMIAKWRNSPEARINLRQQINLIGKDEKIESKNDNKKTDSKPVDQKTNESDLSEDEQKNNTESKRDDDKKNDDDNINKIEGFKIDNGKIFLVYEKKSFYLPTELLNKIYAKV